MPECPAAPDNGAAKVPPLMMEFIVNPELPLIPGIRDFRAYLEIKLGRTPPIGTAPHTVRLLCP